LPPLSPHFDYYATLTLRYLIDSHAIAIAIDAIDIAMLILILIFHDAMIHIIIAIFLSPILHFITYH
jgi:hypothetical protein